MNEKNTWEEYIDRNFNKFLLSLKDEDFINGKKVPPTEVDVDLTEPQKAYDSLRRIITHEAIKKFQNRFRAHKHRANKGIKNLQLKAHTLKMIDKFKVLVGAETLEEAFDFLLSPDYRDYEHDVDNARQRLGDERFGGEELMVEGFTRRLKNYDRERLLLIIEQAFNKGWVSAKKSKKRTGNPRKEALGRFETYSSVLQLTELDEY